MKTVNANPYGIGLIGRQQISGEMDFIRDDILNRGANVSSVMVNDEFDLDALNDIYTPGTVAYTAGFKKIWQLNAAGSWISVS